MMQMAFLKQRLGRSGLCGKQPVATRDCKPKMPKKSLFGQATALLVPSFAWPIHSRVLNRAVWMPN
jgi:hypothetical protein